jgi:hypothetical protein
MSSRCFTLLGPFDVPGSVDHDRAEVVDIGRWRPGNDRVAEPLEEAMTIVVVERRSCLAYRFQPATTS